MRRIEQVEVRRIERGWGEAEEAADGARPGWECGGSSEVDFCRGVPLYSTVV
jgi:hypothetical protein